MTMTLISTVVVGAGGAANITFSAIPQTYTDLVVLLSARHTAGDYVAMSINGLTTNRTVRMLYAYNSTTVTSETRTDDIVDYGMVPNTNTANTFGNTSIYFPNYSSSINKSFSVDGVRENNSTSGVVEGIGAGLWASTAAITSLSFYSTAGTIMQYSSASLYGILKGSGGATVS